MLRVSDLSVYQGPHPILERTSLQLCAGETRVIMGPSGSGKTTLLKAIAGFVDRIHGNISYNKALWQDSKSCYVPSQKRECALLFQEHAIWPHLTVQRQLEMVGPGTASLMERIGLNGATLGRHLSGGEKQRLALGRVLLTHAPLLLLDEPFSALDQERKASIISLLKEHQEKHKCAILIATHEQTDASQLGATVLSLSRC